MKTRLLLLAVLGCSVAGLSTGCKMGEKKEMDQKMSLADCPQAVQDTIKKEAGNGTIEEVEKEVEDGKTVYSADITVDGKKYDLDVSPDGKVVKKELEDGKEEHDDMKK